MSREVGWEVCVCWGGLVDADKFQHAADGIVANREPVHSVFCRASSW